MTLMSLILFVSVSPQLSESPCPNWACRYFCSVSSFASFINVRVNYTWACCHVYPGQLILQSLFLPLPLQTPPPPLFVSGNLILVRFWTFLRNGLITALLNAKRERWRMVCNWIKTIAHHRTRQPHLRCRCFPPLVTANSLLKIGVVVF